VDPACGPEHEETAKLVNNLASVLLKQKKLQEAHPVQERAVAVATALFGRVHANTCAPLRPTCALILSIRLDPMRTARAIPSWIVSPPPSPAAALQPIVACLILCVHPCSVPRLDDGLTALGRNHHITLVNDNPKSPICCGVDAASTAQH
jgi:hypothetical protein